MIPTVGGGGGGGGSTFSVAGQDMPEHQLVNSIARLSVTDPEAAKSLLEQYGPDIDPRELERVGLKLPDQPQQDDTSFLDKAKNVGGGALQGFLDIIDRPSQAVLKGLETAVGHNPNKDQNVLQAMGEGLSGGGEHVNLRDVAGVPHDAGGLPAGVFDFIGSAALDPLTWVTLGTGGAAKAGLKAIAESGAEGLGKEAAQTVAKKGLAEALGEGGSKLTAGGALTQAGESEGRTVLREELLKAAEAAGAKDPAKTAAKMEMALDKGAQGGVKLFGTSVVPGSALGKAADVTGASALADKLKESAPGQWAQGSFVPRSEIVNRYGQDAADTVWGIDEAAKAGKETAVRGVIQDLRSALKGVKLSEEDTALLRNANDVGGEGWTKFAERMRSEGRDDLAQVADALRTTSEGATQHLTEGVGISENALHDPETYMPRFLTKEGQKYLSKEANQARWGVTPDMLQTEAGAGGALNARTFMPDKSISEINDIFKGEGVGKLMEDNPTANVLRHYDAAAGAAAKQQIIDNLAQLTDDEGRKLLSTNPADLTSASEKVQVRPGYVVHAEPAIAHDLQKQLDVVTNDQALKEFGNFMDKWMGLWKGYATVPVIFGSGFHARNGVGNLFLNYLAGVNPKYMAEAAQVQKALPAAEKFLTENGGDLRAALKAAGVEDGLAERAALAREKGIDVTGYVHSDLPTDKLAQVPGAADHNKVLAAVNPVSRSNALVRSGQKIGETVENNARLANFLDGLDKLGSADEAALRVKKYLFDYGELTPFERRVMKRIVPFYTFMRNNTPLMIEQSAKQPGKFSVIPKLESNLATAGGGAQDLQGKEVAPYALAKDLQPLPKFLSEALAGQGNSVLANVELPTSNAAKTLQPLVQALSVVPGVQKLIPKEVQPKDGLQEIAQQLINMPGGGVNEAVKYLIERGTGSKLFTGAPLKGGSEQDAVDLVNAILPQAQKGENLVKKITDPQAAKAQLLDTVLGVNTNVVTPESQKKEQERRKFDLNDLLAEMKAQGNEVPQLSDLVKAGLLPKSALKQIKLTEAEKVSARAMQKLQKASAKEQQAALKQLLSGGGA